MITFKSALLSDSTLTLVKEWHASNSALDSVSTEVALLHDAIHAYCGLSTSLEDEEVVSNVANLLAGLETSDYLTERVSFLVSLLEVDVLIELSNACTHYYA